MWRTAGCAAGAQEAVATNILRGIAPPATTPAARQLRSWFALAGVGAIIVAVAAFLPWVTLAGAGIDVSPTGLDAGGDGLITLALGLIVDGLCLWAVLAPRPPRGVPLAILVLGFVMLGIPGLDYSSFQRGLQEVDPAAASLTHAGVGLYGTALGGILVVFGAWQGRRSARRLPVAD